MFRRKERIVYIDRPAEKIIVNDGNDLLQSLERQMWSLGNDLRTRAKYAQSAEAWARYDGLEQAKAILIREMAKRGIRPK